MSFSSDAKEELCLLPADSTCCSRAELAGLFALSGTLLSSRDGGGLRLRTENRAVAERMLSLLKGLFSLPLSLLSTEKKGKGKIYLLYLSSALGAERILKALGLWQEERPKFRVDPFITAESCCRRAFLRGAFLAAGSVNAPLKSYHLEIETHHHDLARDLLQLFEDEQLLARSVIRKSNYVVYMKDSEEIADALTAFGATDSALELYHIKVEKDMKNKINRQVNCETANLTKIANTAARQIKAITRILNSPLYHELSPAQLELADLRLKNPEASLSELAALMSEPVSKSGVSRRLQRMIEMAEAMEEKA